MQARALRTILSDGVWTLQRAEKHKHISQMGSAFCVMRAVRGLSTWWECPALNKVTDLGLLHLKQRRKAEDSKP
eukprot:1595332-Heterocapsa_arctica.AAC.1